MTLCISKIYYKKFLFFFFSIYENEQKEYKFNDKKIRKSDFYKNKKINKIDDIDVNNILVSKKESYINKNSLNTLSDIMIMIILVHYV